jgi:hypothetical protein
MLAIQKNITKFVVRINSNCNGAITTNKAETKILGRQTVASTAVISVHRMELVRSDLPSFINSKSFFMRTKDDECATCAKNQVDVPALIIDSIISSDDPDIIRENLRVMMDAFFMYYDNPAKDIKVNVFCTYQVLNEALKQMKQFNSGRVKPC